MENKKEKDLKISLHRIDGAIIGLTGMEERLTKIVKKEKKKDKYPFTMTPECLFSFIDYQMKIYKGLKIKKLEELIKNKRG